MLRVLIVDDSEMLSEMFGDYLAHSGFVVVGVVGNVADAIEMAALHKPDVALVDYYLGKRLGTEIVARVPAASRPAILYISGRPLDNTLTSDDGEGFIQKPVSLADLACALTAVWEAKRTGSVTASASPQGLRWLQPPPANAQFRIAQMEHLPDAKGPACSPSAASLTGSQSG